jgi:SNF2 family DNA or RNA helicase
VIVYGDDDDNKDDDDDDDDDEDDKTPRKAKKKKRKRVITLSDDDEEENDDAALARRLQAEEDAAGAAEAAAEMNGAYDDASDNNGRGRPNRIKQRRRDDEDASDEDDDFDDDSDDDSNSDSGSGSEDDYNAEQVVSKKLSSFSKIAKKLQAILDAHRGHGKKEEELQQPPHIPAGFALKRHQVAGLAYLNTLHDEKLNLILADEMGLGKTIQIVCHLSALLRADAKQGPFLVCVPASTRDNWLREFRL